MRILESTSDYFVGVDLGQKHDYTAVCVVERTEEMYDVHDRVTWERKRETRYLLRHMERVRLGTPYTEVVERICEVAGEPKIRGRCELVVDATGVGGPVVDMLRRSAGCEVVPVTITGGDAVIKNGREWRVPKRDLVIGLQVMFEKEEVQISGSMAETGKFMKELMGMRVKVSAAGHDSYGSRREGSHDDLVLAAALGCWRAKTYVRWDLHGSRPLPGM
jgi:phage FluMu gp28-like protein